MHLRVAGFLSFCVVLWHWCNGQKMPEELQKDTIAPPNMFGRESPTNKTMDQIIMEAMGGLKDTLNVKGMHDGILMELDILMSKQQYYSLYEQPNSSTQIRSKRKAIRNPILRWTNGVIPYRFYPGHFNQRDHNMVLQAMNEWERSTCLRFREATSSDINVIVFTNGQGCSSYLGMVGGEQEVSLSSPGCRYSGLYLHEIGHAIGLVHEHQLPNRDDYVEIITENVHLGLLNQFTKYTSQTVDQMNVPYDYSSVMHYSVTAFSKDGVSKTIRVKYPVKEDSIGKADMKELSFTDVQIVNKMYKCHAVCTNKYQDNKQCDTWAKDGQCNANTWIIQNCARSCGRCSGTETTTTPRLTTKLTTQNSIGGCKNLHSDNRSCDAWAKSGYCKTNQYVTIHCAKSCGNCSDQGPSTSSNVRLANTILKTTTEKSLINEVNEEAPADNPNGGCRDEEDTCVTWARYGFCDNNRAQAVRLCPKTCNLCDRRLGLLLR